MSVSSSSSLNTTLDPSPVSSSNSTDYLFYLTCHDSFASHVIYTTYTFINFIFLFPFYILILYMGFQQWRHQRSVPARTATSHSDIFTYHMVLLEIFGVFGSVSYTFGYYNNLEHLLILGVYVFDIIFPGQTLFHCLTCAERYLAVAHPIIYMHLRETRGVRIRNISIACVWLLCFGWVGLTALYLPNSPTTPFLSFTGVCLIVILFCCISVLHVLTHPGPGEVGGNKEPVAQSKQRAFHMIRAIAGVLLLRFVGLLVCFGLEKLVTLGEEDLCWLLDTGITLTIPSSLVLPLLFLHRKGKLACCRRNTESE